MNHVRREGSVQSNHTKRMRRNHVTAMEMEVHNWEMEGEVEWKWQKVRWKWIALNSHHSLTYALHLCFNYISGGKFYLVF